jgi:hypothetical protein
MAFVTAAATSELPSFAEQAHQGQVYDPPLVVFELSACLVYLFGESSAPAKPRRR